MGRRARGEGTVYRRGDGRWEARLTLPDGSRRSFYGRTQQEVLRKLFEAKRLLLAHHYLPGRGPTLGQYLQSWLEAKEASLRPSTARTYRFAVGLVTQELGKVRLDKLRREHLAQLLARLAREGKAPTAHLVRTILRQSMAQAVRDGYIHASPAADLEPPRLPARKQPFLAPDEVRSLLATDDPVLRAAVAIGAGLGLRVGEACALTWDDVDEDEGCVWVRGSYSGEAKTRRSVRRVYMPSFVREALAGLPRTGSRVLGLSPSWLGTRVRRLGLSVLGRPIRFHDLRHACATMLLSQGVHPRLVSEWLGHSQVTTTIGIYGHVLPSLHREAASVLDGLLADSRQASRQGDNGHIR